MDRIIAVVIGLLCGVGQFFIMRYSLKPLSEGGDPQVGRFMLLKLPIPLILLVGYAFVDSNLLPFAGIAFCLSMVLISVANHLATMKKKG